MPARVIHFPKQSTPATRLAAAQTASLVQTGVPRKRGARKASEIATPISSNSVALLDDVKTRIARMWARGVQIAHIAKMYRLTVSQAEAVIWEAHYADDRRAA